MSSMAQMLMMWTLRSSAGSVEYFSLTLIAAAWAPGRPGGAPSASTAAAASAGGRGSVGALAGGRASRPARRPPGPSPVSCGRPPAAPGGPALLRAGAGAAAARSDFPKKLKHRKKALRSRGPSKRYFYPGKCPLEFLRVAKVSYQGGSFQQLPPLIKVSKRRTLCHLAGERGFGGWRGRALPAPSS